MTYYTDKDKSLKNKRMNAIIMWVIIFAVTLNYFVASIIMDNPKCPENASLTVIAASFMAIEIFFGICAYLIYRAIKYTYEAIIGKIE